MQFKVQLPFSAIFTKGNNYCDLQFPFWTTQPFKIGISKKKSAAKRSEFLLKVGPIGKGDKNENASVTFPESIPIYLTGDQKIIRPCGFMCPDKDCTCAQDHLSMHSLHQSSRYRISPATRRGFPLSRMTTNN